MRERSERETFLLASIKKTIKNQGCPTRVRRQFYAFSDMFNVSFFSINCTHVRKCVSLGTPLTVGTGMSSKFATSSFGSYMLSKCCLHFTISFGLNIMCMPLPSASCGLLRTTPISSSSCEFF